MPRRRARLSRSRSIDPGQWRALAQRAIEPNGYYLPGWELAVSATARGRTGRLGAVRIRRLVDAADRADAGGLALARLEDPLPALVSAHPYGTLCSPLIDRDAPIEAATRLLQQAREAGAHALVLNDVALDGAAMSSLKRRSQSRRPEAARPLLLHPRQPRRDAGW